ncbi:MAG: hypothetical protein M3M97_01905 [Actinomycetota bacterium]|nr:hypothetical protein [Actinomycetota bacterium]
MTKRRGNNEGSITLRKDGRWMARPTIHTPEGTKRPCIYGKTREEVRQQLAKVIIERDSGLVFDAENLTVGEYLERLAQ